MQFPALQAGNRGGVGVEEEKQEKEKTPEKNRKWERKVEGRGEAERRETKEEAVYLNLFLEGRMKTFL